MNLDSFTGPGSTPSRRRFWDKVTQAVNASQKLEGRNVSVDEHQGYGTLINVTRGRSQPPPTGCPASITFSGIEFCCFPDGFGGSTMLFEPASVDPPNVINDLAFTLSDISPSDPCDTRCSVAIGTTLGFRGWDTSDCTTDPISESSIGVAIYVVHAAGVWYVIAITAVDGIILFYGTTTDLGTPASNEVICNETVVYDNNAFTCLFSGTSTSLGVAQSGTATITP